MIAPVRHGNQSRPRFWPRFLIYALSVAVVSVVALFLVVSWAPHPASGPAEVDQQLPTVSVLS